MGKKNQQKKSYIVKGNTIKLHICQKKERKTKREQQIWDI